MPQVQVLWPDGGTSFQPIRPFFGPQGEMDLGGLAPGTYRIGNVNGSAQPYELRVSAGSARAIDLNAAIATTPVRMDFDMPEGVRPPGIRLVDTATGGAVAIGERNTGPARGEAFSGSERPIPPMSRFSGEEGRPRDGREDRNERKIDLVPGRYEVILTNERSQFLIGLSAEEAAVDGTFVVIGPAACRITLHIAHGRSAVTGSVLDAEGVPASGAMVLLVPAKVGDPQHFVGIERAQTNTDGSFTLKDALPGQYILVAIRDGWSIDWHDLSTLGRYLVHGSPVELNGTNATHETLQAQRR